MGQQLAHILSKHGGFHGAANPYGSRIHPCEVRSGPSLPAAEWNKSMLRRRAPPPPYITSGAQAYPQKLNAALAAELVSMATIALGTAWLPQSECVTKLQTISERS